MQITIIAVGKALPPDLQAISRQYEQRLQPDISIDWKLIPAAVARDALTCRTEECKTILRNIQKNDTVILLDERGVQQTNHIFAQTLERFLGAHGRLVFVIGGAFGVTDVVRQRATFVWSLSLLVFPHMLIRIMLLEQLYRTSMIQKGHPYHHS